MEAEELAYRRRLGFWLRMARERAGKSQGGAAEYLGFSAKSKSSISDYENGRTPVPLAVLRRLAEWYGVPLAVFTEPQRTPEERLDEIVHLAASRESRQWAEGAGPFREDGAGPNDEPQRRSA